MKTENLQKNNTKHISSPKWPEGYLPTVAELATRSAELEDSGVFKSSKYSDEEWDKETLRAMRSI